MRLLSYENGKNHIAQLGVIVENRLIDTSKLAEHLNLNVPKTITAFLKNCDRGRKQIETCLSKADELNMTISDYTVLESNIRYLPTVQNPEKILCVGMNYVEHIKATGGEVPITPVFFSKFSNALAAHQQNILLPTIAQEVDYEAELVIVIGKEVHNACEVKAAEAILGYTVGNDLSERSLQFQSSQWLIGKSLDHFAPIGPVLVTKDELENVQNLTVLAKLNGEIVQQGTTADMLFPVEKIVSQVSQYMTLKPGDIIFTGTPRGVILEKNDHEARWLQSGDKIDISIEGIGTLSNALI